MLLGILSPILNLCMLQKNLIKQERQKICWGAMANEQKNPEDSLGCTLHKRGWGVAQIGHPRSTAPTVLPSPASSSPRMWHWAHPDLLLPLSVGVGNLGHHNTGLLQNTDEQKEYHGVYFYLLQVLRSATIYLSCWYNFSNHWLFIYPYLLCSGYLPC